MNSFGLGLVLNFTDNASSGMRRVSQTFNEMNGLANQVVDSSDAAAYSVQTLTAAGLGLTIVGEQFTQIGEAITGVFSSIISKVTEVGTTVMGQKLTLNTLFKSAEEGEKAFQWTKEFAKTSIFNFEDLLPAMTTMKSVGIDIRDEVTATSGATQNLLEYAGDLAAVFPQMHNAYGTGVNAAMGALKEYIAEGNALSLKRGAGLDITQILGEDKGKSIEDRTRQVADLVDKMGILGMTAQLAGTPMQRLSNVQDTLFSLITEISDSGVFQKYTDLIAKFTDYIFAIPDEEMTNIAQVIGDALVSLMSPLEKLLDVGIAVADWVRTLIKEHPGIAKMLVTVTAFAGVLLVGVGTALKFAGSIFLLAAGLQMFGLNIGKGVSFANILTRSIGFLFNRLLPIAAVAGLIYVAWKNNLFGIRDLVTKVFKDVGTVLSVVFDAFSDNALTEDMWLKARDLGILPFVESILLLKYYWGFFVEGFKKGFSSFFETINKVAEKFGILDVNVFGMANSIGEVISKLTGEDMQGGWEAIGEVVGGIVASLLIIIPLMKIMGIAFKAVKAVVTVVKDVWLVFTKVGPAVTKIGGALTKILTIGSKIGSFFTATLWPALQAVGSAIMGVLTAIASALGISVGWVIAIIAAVVALVAVIIIYRDEIAAFFVNLGTAIGQFFSNLWGTVTEWWSNLVNTIVQSPIFQTVAKIFNAIKTVVVSFVQNAIEVFKSFGNMVWNILQGIWGVFVSVFEFIKAVVKNAIDIVVGIFRVLYETVRIIVYSVIWVFQQVFSFINDNVIQPFVGWITEKFQWLKDNVFTPVGEFFKQVWQSVVDFVTPIIEGIGNVFTDIANSITEVFTNVKDFFVGVFDTIGEKAGEFFGWISEKLGWVTEAINNIGSFFSNGINAAGDWLSGVGDKMKKAVGLNTGGYVKTTGMAMLHPNEVVVNDQLTRQLGLFLDDYQERPTGTSSSPKPVVVNQPTDVTPKPSGNAPMTTVVPVSRGTVAQSVPQPVQNDYSVTFSAGSVIIQLANATEAELEKAADKLMKIIERKQQLKQMAVRA